MLPSDWRAPARVPMRRKRILTEYLIKVYRHGKHKKRQGVAAERVYDMSR